MDWPLIFAAFIIGIILGYIGRSLLSRNQNCQQTNDELEQAKLELSQYKQDVSDSISQHRKLLVSLNEQIDKVNEHWNEANTSLLENPKSQLPTSSIDMNDKLIPTIDEKTKSAEENLDKNAT